jgi:hypothetical protein
MLSKTEGKFPSNINVSVFFIIFSTGFIREIAMLNVLFVSQRRLGPWVMKTVHAS